MHAKWFAYIREMVRVHTRDGSRIFRVFCVCGSRILRMWFAYFAYVREMVRVTLARFCVSSRILSIFLTGFSVSSRILRLSHGILRKFGYFTGLNENHIGKTQNGLVFCFFSWTQNRARHLFAFVFLTILMSTEIP